MLLWLTENAATILITAALAVLVFFILRGMVRGKIRTCGDCGGECATGCGACQYRGACRTNGEAAR